MNSIHVNRIRKKLENEKCKFFSVPKEEAPVSAVERHCRLDMCHTHQQ